MNQYPKNQGISSRISRAVSRFGPAIFIVGYVIGTGSVTSMVVSGAAYGLNLSWALFLSCFFTYFLIVAISRLTIVSGQTLMYNFRKNFGKPVTIFIMISLLSSIVSSIIGVMGIASEVFAEWLKEMNGTSRTFEIDLKPGSNGARTCRNQVKKADLIRFVII